MIEQIQNDDALSPAMKDYLLGNRTALIGSDVEFKDIKEPPLPGESVSLHEEDGMLSLNFTTDWISYKTYSFLYKNGCYFYGGPNSPQYRYQAYGIL
ncbi:MAG: hypothetical protein J1E61_04825 [Lachnospiraceae bacterium]|nr:hypothetical protein [Lachnospiraceae bacterium]